MKSSGNAPPVMPQPTGAPNPQVQAAIAQMRASGVPNAPGAIPGVIGPAVPAGPVGAYGGKSPQQVPNYAAARPKAPPVVPNMPQRNAQVRGPGPMTAR
jgi:hypothetical protein